MNFEYRHFSRLNKTILFFVYSFVDSVRCDPDGVDDCELVLYKDANPLGLSVQLKRCFSWVSDVWVGFIQGCKPSGFGYSAK
jgi:hypothetical protein